jgi:hypothetical protein
MPLRQKEAWQNWQMRRTRNAEPARACSVGTSSLRQFFFGALTELVNVLPWKGRAVTGTQVRALNAPPVFMPSCWSWQTAQAENLGGVFAREGSTPFEGTFWRSLKTKYRFRGGIGIRWHGLGRNGRALGQYPGSALMAKTDCPWLVQ